MELSPRLSLIARQVPFGAHLADIGTDHAYLPVWLLKQGQIAAAIASDLREGPLTRGQAIAAQWGIGPEQISFRLSDGLHGLQPEEADTIVIAGMGGDTIVRILEEPSWSQHPALLYLLQPMSAIDELRLWLSEHGFQIEDESIALEGMKYYLVLRVRPGHMRPLTLGERAAGRQVKGMVQEHRQRYLEDLIRRYRRALAGMRRAARSLPTGQLIEKEQTLAELSKMHEEWILWQQ